MPPIVSTPSPVDGRLGLTITPRLFPVQDVLGRASHRARAIRCRWGYTSGAVGSLYLQLYQIMPDCLLEGSRWLTWPPSLGTGSDPSTLGAMAA